MTLKGHKTRINDMVFSPDGKKLVSRTSNNTKIWDALTGQEIFTYKTGNYAGNSISFTSDSKRFAIASPDRTVRILNSENGKELLSLKGHRNSVKTISFINNDKRLISGARDASIIGWDALDWRKITTPKEFEIYIKEDFEQWWKNYFSQ